MKTIILFDVDGTLTKPRLKVESDIINMISKLNKNNSIDIGIVGGSDFKKQQEQLGDDVLSLFDYVFSENGLVSYCNNELFHSNSFVDFIGEKSMKKLINLCLKSIIKADPPKKRGTFIENRTGMLNISPVGRSCSQEEREEFFNYDNIHNIRKEMINEIDNGWKVYKYENPNLNITDLSFSIGGQISIDIFPKNWDKTYCLQFLKDKYQRIIFIGDKTYEGGNDYEIFINQLTESYSTDGPEKTIKIINTIKF